MSRRERASSNRPASPRRGENEPSPAREELEKLGEGEEPEEEAPPAWLQEAAARHEQRQRGYASLFDRARDSVEREKADLSGLLDRVAESQPASEEPPPPALFEDASRDWQERQRSLGGIFGEAARSRQQEREALKKMFERPPRRGGSKT